MFSGYQKGRVGRKELIFILTIYDLDLNSLIIRINNDQVFALKSNYPAHLVKFTEEILNGKLYFLCSDRNKCDFPIARFK